MILTWLPLPSFKDSVMALNDEHLGAQRLHVLAIIERLHEVEVSDLPADFDLECSRDAAAMWEGYEMQLLEYGLEACDEWASRKGKRDRIYPLLAKHLDWATSETSNMEKPPWFGNVDFHLGHQAALVRADPAFYSRQFLVDTSRKLIWPIATDG